jgi:glycosyltransferase involved in cell wall biosynthesis
MTANDLATARPLVSVIVPARNEEASLGTCLESLVTQIGVDFEIIVVDDHSTDQTHEIAESFAGRVGPDAPFRVARECHADSLAGGARRVRVIEAGPLPAGWTGKNNAVATGAREARGEWLLFTDADTVHLPGSLSRAFDEAQQHGVDLLSYSPEQIAVTFWEMATLPVVFAELARQYPPSKVSDPDSPAAAANGQYILVKRAAYDAIGGHAAVAHDILEDVALARAMKSSGRKIRFRYAADAVRTRMYRNYAQLRDGWTKNLALLFPSPAWLAISLIAVWGVSLLLLGVSIEGVIHNNWKIAYYMLPYALLYARISRAHFNTGMNLLALFFGMPMFAYLLLRSAHAHKNGKVPWKGRTYGATDNPVGKSLEPSRRIAEKLS